MGSGTWLRYHTWTPNMNDVFFPEKSEGQGSPLVGGPLALRPYRSREARWSTSLIIFLEPSAHFWQFWDEKLEPLCRIGHATARWYRPLIIFSNPPRIFGSLGRRVQLFGRLNRTSSGLRVQGFEIRTFWRHACGAPKSRTLQPRTTGPHDRTTKRRGVWPRFAGARGGCEGFDFLAS